MNELVVTVDTNGTQMVQMSPEFANLMMLRQHDIIALQEAENRRQEIIEIVEQAMDMFKVDEITIGNFTYKRTKPYTRTTIDSKKLKANYPDIAKECSRVSEVAGSIKESYDD